MAKVFSGLTLRAVDSNDDIRRIQTWGAVSADCYDKLASLIDAQSAIHGLKVVGKIEKYYDSNAKGILDSLVVPQGAKLVKGQLIIGRSGAGSVYFKGKFPADQTELDKICQSLITGTKTIGTKTIEEVVPRVNTGSRFKRA